MGADDRAVVIPDAATGELGAELHRVACELAPRREHRLVVMEELGPRDPQAPLAFPAWLGEEIRGSTVSVYAATGAPGELGSFRRPLLEAVGAHGTIRHGHMPNVTPEILALGFGDDYQRVVELTARVLERVAGARRARVTTALGTELAVEFDPRFRWVPSDGIIAPGSFGNIPSGEVFTCLGRCDGLLVIDGEVGDHLCAKHGILAETPLEVVLAGGRAVELRSSNAQLREDVARYFEVDDNGNRVGEFAIGTNVNLDRFIGNLLLDEKYPGMHVAFGSGYPDKTGADWDGAGHLDCIVTKPTIEIDGELLMREGEFLL